VAVVAAVLAAGLGALGGAALVDGDAGIEAGPATPAVAASVLDVGALVEAVEPSVVSIETRVESRRGRWATTGMGAGTGVVLEGGLILTNAHVVEGAIAVTVTATDGTDLDATIVAADPSADIAVLDVGDDAGLQPATLGDSDAVRVGQDVVAIGNALALEGSMTVTRGIVSAVGRSIETTSGTLSGLVQTDAAISSGNSGGPLVAPDGSVIGINTAVAAGGGSVSASNIGFAIPIDTAIAVVERLVD
jgi:serine protease Do